MIKRIIVLTLILSIISVGCSAPTQPESNNINANENKPAVVQEVQPEVKEAEVTQSVPFEEKTPGVFDFEDVAHFLAEHRNGFLATVEDGKPKVRPFDFMVEDDGKLYFCTNNQKEVYNQIKAKPYIEFSSSAPGYTWIRLSGEVKFSDDLRVKEKALNSHELVKSIYLTPDNPTFEVFYIVNGEATISSLSGQPTQKFEF